MFGNWEKLSAVIDRRYRFPRNRAASFVSPAFTSGRHRNFSSNGFDLPSTASAMISPSTGANLNPWPQSPAAIINSGRSGSGAIQKFPSWVSQYKQIRVNTIGASASPGNESNKNWRIWFSSSFVTAGSKKIPGEWQRVRGPRSNGHHNRVSCDFFAIFQQDPFYATARLIEVPKLCSFMQFHPKRLRSL